MKRWFALFSLLGVLAAAALALAPHLTGPHERFRQIEPGMPIARVVSLMGEPKYRLGSFLIWLQPNEDRHFVVYIDSDDTVLDKEEVGGQTWMAGPDITMPDPKAGD